MKKFKKALLSILSIALVAILSIGGTLAYLKSEDSDVNVMTMGNVKIAQHEYERAQNNDGSYKTDTIDNQTSYVLQEFTQDKPLYPAVADPHTTSSGWDSIPVRMSQVDSYGGMSMFAEPNAQDKFVTVENTGRSEAYVRTLVAIEVGEGDASLIGINYHQNAWKAEQIGTIEVDNNKYYLLEFIYAGAQLSDGSWRHENGVLPAKDTTYPSLSQVYMASRATNEDCEALDGNSNGRLDILVLSQAVQTKGFANAKTALDTSFGETNATNAALWFAGMKLDVLTELPKKDDQGEQSIIEYDTIINLAKDDSADYVEATESNTVINGNGKTIEVGSASDYGIITRAGNTVINNVAVYSKGGGVAAAKGAKVTFNGESIYVDTASTSGRYLFYAEGAGSEITINGGKFSWDPADNQKRAYIYAGAGTTVYVNGGTFGKASTRSGYTAGILGDGTVIITGGTFGFNPTTWVAAGYKAVQNGSTWTVVAE